MPTCHWCHVMERESFEDAEVAEVLNRHFVAVKVDREERPDVDHIYMTVCQALTGQGGWPLTVILTPDQEPLFAGTYFPKTGRLGRPGLLDVLRRMAALWERERDRLLRGAKEVLAAVRPVLETSRAGSVGPDLLAAAYEEFAARFDPAFGGFGPAPKFPTPHNLVFLLRLARRWQREVQAGPQSNAPGPAPTDLPDHAQEAVQRAGHALHMAERTLEGMYRGGLFDHVGFGFARYSTDRQWLVPHFEKMLYDNALLAIAYAEAWQVTGRPWYAQVSRDVLTWALREMAQPEGGFAAALDADSEGQEGKFYLWTPDEVRAVLGAADGDLYCRLYDITPEGNFEGGNIPNLLGGWPETFARAHGLDPARFGSQVREWNHRLYEHRKRRVHPDKDDKVLTGWNGLMIAALAATGKALGDAAFVTAAARAEAFVRDKLTAPDGRLFARYRDGEAKHLAYADDYAFLIWGLLELYAATWDTGYLERAVALQRQMLDRFGDEQAGGFYLYASDGERLVARPKEVYDGATPSANSVAALNLLRLARLTGDVRFEQEGQRVLAAFAGDVAAQPAAFAHYLTAVMFALGPVREAVVTGREGADDTLRLKALLQSLYLPDAVVLFYPSGSAGQAVERLAPFTRGMGEVQGRAAVYICENFTCQQPEVDPARVRSLLGGGGDDDWKRS
ncbi:MAG: thioredoxin domain-containing protein [Alicyclobacillaceae bacterium]|nr:thioredoxin domain-containing protein [Alicyclobacillaceae bacterium]